MVNAQYLLDVIFQFTPLREGRPARRNGDIATKVISIHAPPRGATILIINFVGGELFQFTPLREGRRDLYYSSWGYDQFQFTPLREGRRRNISR